MNVILTMNGGNYWHPHARASVLAAARRWGCEVVEVTDRMRARDWFAAKFRLGRHCPPDGRCLYLDADVVIRSDCPSPFDLVPAGDFGAVLNFQPGMVDHERYQRPSWEKACSMLGVDRPYSVGEYINAGLILFGPEHLPVLHTLDRRVTNTDGVNEQASWSVAMAEAGVTYLPATFNRVGPAVWESGPVMTEYVYHFASYLKWRPEQKAAMIQQTQWSVP